jgi:hypothetical protein
MEDYKKVKRWDKKRVYELVKKVSDDYNMPYHYTSKDDLLTMIPIKEIIDRNYTGTEDKYIGYTLLSI